MHPYDNLERNAFWKNAVSTISPFQISEIWRPKFRIDPEHKIVTFGSCFAQHFSRALQRRGYNWLDAEPSPFGLSIANRTRFSYGIFSARTGNIYTTSLLLQWIKWALDPDSASPEIWEHGQRYYDPYRPAIEPNGFASKEELRQSRSEVLKAIRTCVFDSDTFVFTLGLTESWINRQDRWTYPICPGVHKGNFDAERHEFKNLRFLDVLNDLQEVRRLIKAANPDIRLLLTVSPVPLTATASGQHVLTATTASKAILRAVAHEMGSVHDDVDYFPSFEIIAGTPFKGVFYQPNQREVSEYGVNFVMNLFFHCQNLKFKNVPDAGLATRPEISRDILCEDAWLEAFGGAT